MKHSCFVFSERVIALTVSDVATKSLLKHSLFVSSWKSSTLLLYLHLSTSFFLLFVFQLFFSCSECLLVYFKQLPTSLIDFVPFTALSKLFTEINSIL